MDQQCGVGRWRPLPRHLVWQLHKWRPIDDGRRARTNALTTLTEIVVCVPPEFAVITAKLLAMAFYNKHGHLPTWFRPAVSIED